MSLGTVLSAIVVFGVVPLAAIGLSYLARSKVLKLFLRYGGLYFGIALNLNFLFEADCATDKFLYYRCSAIPQVIAEVFSFMNVLTMVVYVFWAPPILVLLLLWELKVRMSK
jgi:hypothetical protein